MTIMWSTMLVPASLRDPADRLQFGMSDFLRRNRHKPSPSPLLNSLGAHGQPGVNQIFRLRIQILAPEKHFVDVDPGPKAELVWNAILNGSKDKAFQCLENHGGLQRQEVRHIHAHSVARDVPQQYGHLRRIRREAGQQPAGLTHRKALLPASFGIVAPETEKVLLAGFQATHNLAVNPAFLIELGFGSRAAGYGLGGEKMYF